MYGEHSAGKGFTHRKMQVSFKERDKNYERIFNKEDSMKAKNKKEMKNG